jgi:hypothetical protein
MGTAGRAGTGEAAAGPAAAEAVTEAVAVAVEAAVATASPRVAALRRSERRLMLFSDTASPVR